MSKPRLTPTELYQINQNEAQIASLLRSLENAKRFNVGDFLIRHKGPEKTPEKNSYFVERRFQVVHVDNNGVPYVKEVMGNKTNSWAMPLSSLKASMDAVLPSGHSEDEYSYSLDPLYEDHILMQQEGVYDPSSLQKDKSKTFKEITTHNKSIKIKTSKPIQAYKFAKSIKVGDTFWFSNVTSFLVQEIKVLPKSFNMESDSFYEAVIIGVTNKGKKLKLSVSDLSYKAVYTACPRSYKELKT